MKRIALVTGAGRGIGQAIARELAAAGFRVAVTARSVDQLEQTVRQIVAAGGEALAIAADLLERPAHERIVETVRSTWGDVQVLVNNAGIGSSIGPNPVAQFDDAMWDLTLALNLTAPYRLTKLVLPAMIAEGWGRIINISSINAKVPSIHGCAYTASKHGLAGLTKNTAIETAQVGITCNAICPGVTATAMNDRRIAYDATRLHKTTAEIEAAASPLGRRLIVDEIAPLAVFLASDGASAINGQLINVCGGTILS